MPLNYADPARPNPVTILGRRIVLWKSTDGWAAVEDACPHRLAPLSTGAIGADGTLVCRFHGWRFDQSGACVAVPNAPSAQAAARLCGASWTCARSYPVVVSGGLVFVWMESGPEGAARAATTPLPSVEHGADGAELSWELNVQPISYESMVENSLDPSHAPFLHAGVGTFGKTPTAIPMEAPAVSTKPSASGFVIKHGGYDQRTAGMRATRRFAAPSLVDVRYTYRYTDKAEQGAKRGADRGASAGDGAAGEASAAAAPPEGRKAHFPIYFVPSTAYETRVLVGIALPSTPSWVPAAVREPLADLLHVIFFSLEATWRFNDQDRYTMEGQDLVQAEEPDREQLAFRMATPSDVGVLTFRRWLALVGGGPFAADPAARRHPPPRREELSRWNAHGKHCPRCRAGMRQLATLRALSGRGAFASTALAALALAFGGHASVSAAAGLLALALYGLARFAEGTQRAMLGRADKEVWIEDVYPADSLL